MVKKILAKGFIYLMLFLMYLPIFVLIIFSFTSSETIGVWSGFTFELYGKMFANQDLMVAVGNTILIAFVSAIVSTIIGTLGAIGTFYSSKRYKKTIETITQLPVVNAEIVMALSLAVLFVTITGGKFTFFTLLVGNVVLTVAFVYLSVKPKLQQMDPNIYEAALDLGASPRKALFKVILPEILPGILSGFMLSLTLSLDDFVITQYLKEPSFETLSTYVQKILSKRPMPPEVRALTTFIFLLAVTIVIVNNIHSKRTQAKLAKKGN